MNEVVDLADSPHVVPGQESESTTTHGPGEHSATIKTEEMTQEPVPADVSNKDRVAGAAVEADADGDSEAETLIQSPEKQRTAVDNKASAVRDTTNLTTASNDGQSSAGAATIEGDGNQRKRKRSMEDMRDETTFSTSSRRSSPLSSPGAQSHSTDSDSDVSSSHVAPPRSRPLRWKEEQTSDLDDGDEHSVKNQIGKHRTKKNAAGVDPGSTERRETRSATYPRHSSQERSPSPRPPLRRQHRRGVSTQLTLGDVERKKRGRPPAINTRRSGSADHSRPGLSSDGSDSPQDSRPALQQFNSADHDTMSPAKVAQIRKFRDRNGRSFLARACNNNDLEAAKLRLSERPEDLNMPDNAGNTPLQIAALEGFVEIVEFLLRNKCEVNTRNIDKETPLIDAVENGHVEVVRLLLQNGANPRLGNAKGDEPYELVPQDDENYEEIRKLLADAKEKAITRRVSISTDHVEIPRDGHSSRAASAASPRDSPPVTGPRSPPPLAASRRRTGRSESTRNDLLWQANTQENLTRLAARGDSQGVANILNILQKAETASLIAAAKAGHEEVLQYLLGMGDPEPDPEPSKQHKTGHNTPMLAAIGRGHPEVVQLLVEQMGFNPTRRLLKGKTYFEIAAERKGEQWQLEYDILKSAYDKYAGGKSRKQSSPRATRDADKLKARAARRSQSPMSLKLRNSVSPTLTHKSLSNLSPRGLHKEKERESGSAEGAEGRKRHASRRDAGDPSVAVASDQDQTVTAPKKGNPKKRSHSDLPQPLHLETDAIHRRRRLVTGKEHRRRKSLVAEVSSDEEDAMALDGAEGRPHTALKRTRDSLSPAPAAEEDAKDGRLSVKKRRTVVESSPEETRPSLKKRTNQAPSDDRKLDKSVIENDQKPQQSPIITVPDMMDVDSASKASRNDLAQGKQDPAAPSTEKKDATKQDPSQTAPTASELEVRRREEIRKAADEQRLLEEKLAAEKAAEEKRVADEKAAEERRIAEENDRRRKAEEEAALRKREEEAALRKKEEEEATLRKKEEEEAALRKKEEELALRKKEEEAALRKKEEEAALRKKEEEAALRKREEEERQARIKRELEERQRRQEEQLRQQRLELERRRREALPIVLSTCALMIDNHDPTVKSEAWLSKFLPLFTVRTAQLEPDGPVSGKDDLWTPNFQVAGLLVTKDLNLRNYTSFEKRPVTPSQRQCLWKVSRMMLSYEYATNGVNTSIKQALQREEEERPKFFNMEELFWVKLSDFEDQVFRHPHLATLRLKRQPISLRLIGQPPLMDQSPQPNGLSPKLTNGLGAYAAPPNVHSNGYAR